MEGWVSFHRKIEEWEWYTDPNVFRLFFHLVLKANHKDGKWKGKEIKRGQLITGRKILAKQLNMGEQQVRTAINKLKSTNEITIKPTNKFTLVTIVNYDLYQCNDAELTNKITNEQPTTNQQLTTNNNNNNENIKIIVDFLNYTGKKNYSPTTKKTASVINARLNEGFTVDDFKRVIIAKVNQWKDDESMSKYIRPETLFGTKFEGYLNEGPTHKQQERIKIDRTKVVERRL